MFDPPFIQWKPPRVSFEVRADNQHSIRMFTTAGAKSEGRLRCAFVDDVYGLLRKAFGYLYADKQGSD